MEGMQQFYNPEAIKKMIDPREKAKNAIANVERQISDMLKNDEITKEDVDEMFERVNNRRSTETTH